MNIDGRAWRTIWLEEGGGAVSVIDQTQLPHEFSICSLRSCEEVVDAIRRMVVRGAPLIGVTAAYGLMLALRKNPSDSSLTNAIAALNATRPTAVNLRWALERVFRKVSSLDYSERADVAKEEAFLIAEEDVAMCQAIGENGLELIQKLAINRSDYCASDPINILTHCNAGWLATVDWGTALAPIYKAFRAGLNIHVWVDETRPRNQGSSLTAYELACEGVPHTVIADNAGGYLMQKGQVDAVIVGADRVTATGDVCNKIGTYLKALACFDNGVPFYVALPSSTIDWSIGNGLQEIPIEVRSPMEVTHVNGIYQKGSGSSEIVNVQVCPDRTTAFNPAFDITPARLVAALITEKGVANASKDGLEELYTLAK